MSQKILIPLDGSDIGEAALRYVEEMISNLDAGGKVEVTLIQVLAPQTRRIETGGNSIQAPMTEEEMTPIKQEVLAYLEKSGECLRGKGVDVRCKVVPGKTGTSSCWGTSSPSNSR